MSNTPRRGHIEVIEDNLHVWSMTALDDAPHPVALVVYLTEPSDLDVNWRQAFPHGPSDSWRLFFA